jgi:hypothetical protein
MPAVTNKWEQLLFTLLAQITTVQPEQEYRFHPVRRWRFDNAYPIQKVAFECEGGTWSGGRHVNPIGFAKDCEKYNTATKMGWKVYRLTPKMITEEYLEELLFEEKAE